MEQRRMYAELFRFPAGREGYYGQFGGAFIPEILHETIRELTGAFNEAQADPAFWDAYVALMSSYSCRPTPVTHLQNLSRDLGGAQIYVKREDLNHTGAHKVNNVMGTVCGPHPFPQMVTYFQSLIGREARSQMLEQTGQLPKRVYACVGGGSNASGIFAGFLDDADVELVGVEAGGLGLDSGHHAARLAQNVGSTGVAQGYKTRFLQNGEGQMRPTHSVSAGLDYVGVGPVLAYLHDIGRIRVEAATDAEVLASLQRVMRREGIIPALESAHAFVTALQEAPLLSPRDGILINQSGRGDKDIFTVAEALGDEPWREFLRQKVEEWYAGTAANDGAPA